VRNSGYAQFKLKKNSVLKKSRNFIESDLQRKNLKKSANTVLHWTRIPLRSIPAIELAVRQYERQSDERTSFDELE
jgi:hypothetical protein